MSHGSAQPNANKEINAHFWLELEGISLTAFDKLTIGDSEWSTLEQRAGIDGDYKNINSGLKSTTTITFQKDFVVDGFPDLLQLLQWHEQGSKDRRSGAVVIMNRDNDEKARINFKDGWLSKCSQVPLDALNDNEPIPFEFEMQLSRVEWSD